MYWNFSEIHWTWKEMMGERAIDPTVKICDEWLTLDGFSKWWTQNYYPVGQEKMYFEHTLVDKSGTNYCPENCFFLPKTLHNQFSYKNNKYKMRSTNKLPSGIVTNNNGRAFVVQMRNPLKKTVVYIGTYPTIEMAFVAFKNKKEFFIQSIVKHYQKHLPNDVFKLLMEYKVELDD